MKIINRRSFYLIFLGFLLYGCYAQVPLDIDKYMQGEWKIVLHDYRGYQKFSLIQANQIKNSTLTIEKDKYYYRGIDFIDVCHFEEWKKISLDSIADTDFHGLSLKERYSIDQLKKIIRLIPQQKDGSFNCYNECNLFFLKQDTLINICGGYTYYFVKKTMTRSHADS